MRTVQARNLIRAVDALYLQFCGDRGCLLQVSAIHTLRVGLASQKTFSIFQAVLDPFPRVSNNHSLALEEQKVTGEEVRG